ncbi:MAG: VCBS repeat-containing protein [Candidatus Promineifilaceae bacterium]
MNKKLSLLLITTLLAFLGMVVIFGTVSAEPPPCLTINLCFEKAIKVTSFTGAQDLAVGYINSGSNLDFVTTGWGRDKIRFKTGNGDGTFWGTWTENMGDGTYEVDLADFNDDGATDIIATNSEQDRVYIRWGLSGWNNVSTWTTDDRPHYVATADLNNDGLDDFATGNTSAGPDSVTVRLRQSGGGFEAPTNYAVHNEFIGDIAFNDCDHDGDLDMFYPAVFTDPYEQEAFVYLRLNDGYGIFTAAWGIDADSEGYGGLSLGSITFGDLNEDGWDDFVVTRSDHKLVRVLGGVNCSFHEPIVSDVQMNPTNLEIADLNGDGHLDIVLAHLFPKLITIYLGQGNGNMSGAYQPNVRGLGDVHDVGVGDFNNDGLMDIIYAEDYGGVWLLLGREENAPPWLPPWLEVSGIPFIPTGGAQTYTVNNTIIIQGFGSSGDEGVDALLDSASLWSTDLDIEGYDGSKLYLDTVANESTVGSLGLVSTQSGLEMWPLFNPTDYRIEYWLDDQLQLALTLPGNSQTPAAVIRWDADWCTMNTPPGDPPDTCRLTLQTSVEGGGGAFLGDSLLWYDGFVIDDDVAVTVANGNLVMANHIRVSGIPDGQGSEYGNGFSRMEIRGAVLESLTLSNVMMESAEPPPADPLSFELYMPFVVHPE